MGSVSYEDTIDQRYGTFARANELGEAVVDDILEDRYEEMTGHRIRDRWAEWLGKPYWNLTLVAGDRRYRWAWVLVATDEGRLETTSAKTSI